VGTIITVALLMIAGVGTGNFGRHLVFYALLQTSIGCVSAFLCYVNTQYSRMSFAMFKRVKLAAKQSRKLLHTLIPPNVLQRLASRSDDSHDTGMLAAEIPHCKIMFMSMHDPQRKRSAADRRRGMRCREDEVEEFNRLHQVYVDFDNAVANSGLFKYQHVGAFYIVTCSNAAEPFEPQPQHTSLETEGGQRPAGREVCSHATDMVRLARQLAGVARQHGFQIRVGMHAGDAAGAVVGKLRSFYCIYGKTMNAASRLCQHTDPDQMQCSAAFLACLQDEGAAAGALSCGQRGPWPFPGVEFEPRAPTLFKGFSRSLEIFGAPCIDQHELAAGKQQSGLMDSLSTGPSKAEIFNVDAFGSRFEERVVTDVDVRAALGNELDVKCADGGQVQLFNVDAFENIMPERPRANANRNEPARPRSDGVRRPSVDIILSLSGDADLSAESKALLNDKTVATSQRVVSFGFDDASTEERFMEDEAGNLKFRVGAGVIVHVLGIIFQLVLMRDPPHALHFNVLGRDLEAAHERASRVLLLHLAVQNLVSLLVVLALWRAPARWTESLGLLLVLLRLVWLVVSITVCQIWPMKQYLLTFASLYSLSQFVIVSCSMRPYTICWAVSHLLYIAMYHQSRKFITVAFVFRFLCTSISIWFFNMWAEDARRRRWLLHRVFHLEMKRLSNILGDLLPLWSVDARTSASSALGAGDGIWPHQECLRPSLDMLLTLSSQMSTCSHRQALVLQLDIVGFTGLSQRITPLQLAQVLLSVFSRAAEQLIACETTRYADAWRERESTAGSWMCSVLIRR